MEEHDVHVSNHPHDEIICPRIDFRTFQFITTGRVSGELKVLNFKLCLFNVLKIGVKNHFINKCYFINPVLSNETALKMNAKSQQPVILIYNTNTLVRAVRFIKTH